MTIIENLAEWAFKLDYDGIPDRVKQKARLQTLSVLGAIHASSRHEIGQSALAGVESFAADGPCTVIATGKTADIMSAVYANSCLAVSLDYDDYLLFGHTGASAVPVTLAVAEKEQTPLKSALTAQVIANEVEGRLGASVVFGPHNGQGWSHIHLLGSALAAAKMMGLSEEKIAHAMAIAMYQPTYVLWPGFMGPDSKTTTAATPAVTGLQAAYLARAGATGPLDVLEHPQGFLARFSFMPTDFFISGLGRSWTTDTLAYKIYPGCAYIDTTVDAVLKLREAYREEWGEELNPDEVNEVLVEGTILTVEMDNLSRTGGSFDPLNPVSINFSIPGNVALCLLNGRLDAEDITKKNLLANKERVLKLADKVKLVHDWGLTARFLEAMDNTLPIHDILDEIDIADLGRVRSRIQGQYQSSMGFTLADLKEIWKKVPGLRGRAPRFLIERVFRRLRRGDSDGFDLGLCRLEKFIMPFSARVTLRLSRGRAYTFTQDIPNGGPGHPLDITKEFVVDKYSREARKNIDDETIESFLKVADNFEADLSAPKLMSYCSKLKSN